VNFFLDKIIKHYGVTDKTVPNENITNIISYIYKNYKNEISLDILAKEFNYTKTSVSRLISKYLKTDLRKFVNDIRAEQVRTMIKDPKNSNLSIIDIALSCGFDSVATFYRAYKRRYNELPNHKK
jgi:transcriptional regulator GlxA family with amidase domain